MAVDNTNNFAGMDENSPSNTENWAEGAAHITSIKKTLKRQFPGTGGTGLTTPVTVTADEMNTLAGSDVSTTLQTQITDITDASGTLTGQVEANTQDIFTNASNITANGIAIADNTTLGNTANDIAIQANDRSIANAQDIAIYAGEPRVLGYIRFNGVAGSTSNRGGVVTGYTRTGVGLYTINTSLAGVGLVVTGNAADAIVVVGAPQGNNINILTVQYKSVQDSYVAQDDTNISISVVGHAP